MKGACPLGSVPFLPFRFTNCPAGATILQMGEQNAAQARILIRALCDVLNGMTRRLIWLEHHGGGLAALRRDIREAQTHINRLESRYLSGDRNTAAPPFARQAQ